MKGLYNMNITIFGTEITVKAIEYESVEATISNIDISNLVAELPVNYILDALKANDQFSAVHDWVIKELKADNE